MRTVTFDETKLAIVPIEPTEEMAEAAWESDGNVEYFDNIRYLTRSDLTYSVMITAAPPHPADNTGWISVDDRLPLEHAGVLISFLDQYQYPQIVDGFYFKLRNGSLVWNQNTEFCEAQGGWEGAIIKKQELKVTHWMPLPAAK